MRIVAAEDGVRSWEGEESGTIKFEVAEFNEGTELISRSGVKALFVDGATYAATALFASNLSNSLVAAAALRSRRNGLEDTGKTPPCASGRAPGGERNVISEETAGLKEGADCISFLVVGVGMINGIPRPLFCGGAYTGMLAGGCSTTRRVVLICDNTRVGGKNDDNR